MKVFFFFENIYLSFDHKSCSKLIDVKYNNLDLLMSKRAQINKLYLFINNKIIRIPVFLTKIIIVPIDLS